MLLYGTYIGMVGGPRGMFFSRRPTYKNTYAMPATNAPKAATRTGRIFTGSDEMYGIVCSKVNTFHTKGPAYVELRMYCSSPSIFPTIDSFVNAGASRILPHRITIVKVSDDRRFGWGRWVIRSPGKLCLGRLVRPRSRISIEPEQCTA